MTTNLEVAKSVVAGMLTGSLATIMEDVAYLSELLELDLNAENDTHTDESVEEAVAEDEEAKTVSDTIPAPPNETDEVNDGLMVTTFYNLTVTIAAESAHDAYNKLTDILAVDDIVDYSTDTYNTDADDEERDSEELFA